jgi:hypothetical protein
MGGKAFKDKYSIQRVDKEATRSILEIVASLDKEFAAVGNSENVLLDFIKETGDVDIIINADKNYLFDALDNIKACVDKKKIANNVLTVFSYGGNFYQVDFMTTTDIELGKWLMKGNPDPNGVKGAMRNMLFCMLCKDLSDFASKEGLIKTKFSLSFPGKLRFVSKSSDGTIDKDMYFSDPKQIRSVLQLSKDTKKYQYNTFESVVDYLVAKDIYTSTALVESFSKYIEKSWVAKTMPEQVEKAIEYIKGKQI